MTHALTMACYPLWFTSCLSTPRVVRAIFDQTVMMPFTSQITHVSSERFSSDTEDSCEHTSRPESRSFESPVSVKPLATKFPSPRREALPPCRGPEEDLVPSKMSKDSQMDEGGMWEENPSPGPVSDDSPEISEETSNKTGRHPTESEESSASQRISSEELDRVVHAATLDKGKAALSEDVSSGGTSSGDSRVPFPSELLRPISPRRPSDLKINEPSSNLNPPRGRRQSARLARLQQEGLARQLDE